MHTKMSYLAVDRTLSNKAQDPLQLLCLAVENSLDGIIIATPQVT
jgi:hypothetical protein